MAILVTMDKRIHKTHVNARVYAHNLDTILGLALDILGGAM